MVFGKPAHERAWATRAMLGEERWIDERPMDVAMVVNAGATVAGIAALAAARRRAVPAALATGALVALLLVYWELLARYHDDRHGATP